jgi:hypothetical protein
MDLSRPDWEYVAERAGAFVGRDWVFVRVRSFLSGPPRTLLLRGDPGTGKTAVAARLAQASCGHLDAADSPPPVGEGVISAAVFCRYIPDNDGEYVNALATSCGDADHPLLLAAATAYGTIAIWNFVDGTLLARRSRAHLGDICAMQFG